MLVASAELARKLYSIETGLGEGIRTGIVPLGT